MAGRFHAAENVGPPAPSACLKSALNDDRIAAGHRVTGRGDRHAIDANSIDHRYGDSARFNVLDEALLVERATLRKHFENRVPVLRLLQLTIRNLEIKFREVTAIQMPDQISRAEIQ